MSSLHSASPKVVTGADDLLLFVELTASSLSCRRARLFRLVRSSAPVHPQRSDGDLSRFSGSRTATRSAAGSRMASAPLPTRSSTSGRRPRAPSQYHDLTTRQGVAESKSVPIAEAIVGHLQRPTDAQPAPDQGALSSRPSRQLIVSSAAVVDRNSCLSSRSTTQLFCSWS